MSCLRTTARTRLSLCSPQSIRTRHACHAGIGLDALLKLLADLNHRVADLVNLIALLRNGQKHLPAPAPSSHDVSPSKTGRGTPALIVSSQSRTIRRWPKLEALKPVKGRTFQQKTPIENKKRAAGIEPASSAWKAEVLPLNYARKSRNNMDDLCSPTGTTLRAPAPTGPAAPFAAPSSHDAAPPLLKHDGQLISRLV
jgi:hypothetical protein